MSDVFLSYAREDRATAEKIANALVAKGATVFWDRNIVSGEIWDEVLARELKAARCVIVLWSQHSVASRWVKAEVSEAAERATLLPVLIDQVEIPFQFKPIQTVDLTAWNGSDDDHGFLSLLAGVNRHKTPGENAPAPQSNFSSNLNPVQFRRKRLKLVSWSAVLMVICALSAFALHRVARSKGWFSRPAVPYHTFVQSSEGLAVGDAVLFNGDPVGKITEIAHMPPFSPEGNMFVAFNVRDPFFGLIWTDSRARVQWHPSKQKRSIHITPGGSFPATDTNAILNVTYKFEGGALVGWDQQTGAFIPISETNSLKRGYFLPSEEADAQ